MKKLLILGLGFVLVGCGQALQTNVLDDKEEPPIASEPSGEDGLLPVESAQLVVMESFPVQVNVQVTVGLRNGCAFIQDKLVQRSGNTFKVSLLEGMRGDICTQVYTTQVETIALPVKGIPAGDYTVNINDQEALSFELTVDNRVD